MNILFQKNSYQLIVYWFTDKNERNRMAWKIDDHQQYIIVTINSNQGNRINEGFFQDLHNTLDFIEETHPNKPVVLTAEGNIFSAGLDVVEVFSTIATAPFEQVRDFFKRFRDANLRLFSFPAPTIAVINGHAIAGGTILAMMCDYRIAVDAPIKLGLTEMQVGTPIPPSYVKLFQYVLGESNVHDIVLRGQVILADKAKQVNILHELIPANELEETAHKIAKEYAALSMESYRYTKQIMQQNVLDQIKQLDKADEEAVREIVSPACLQFQAKTFEKVIGSKPPWLDKIVA